MFLQGIYLFWGYYSDNHLHTNTNAHTRTYTHAHTLTHAHPVTTNHTLEVILVVRAGGRIGSGQGNGTLMAVEKYLAQLTF